MAKTSIFNNPYKTVEQWSAQGAVVNWGTAGTLSAPLPLIMQGMGLTYQQATTPIYPINVGTDGGKTRINIKGAPNGTLQVQSIYSPTHAGLEAFIKAVTKECKTDADQVTLTIRPFGTLNCSNDAVGSVLYLTGLDLTTIGLNIQGGEIAMVTMPVNFTFVGLDWEF